MKRILLVIAVVALYALHQDIWFWRTALSVGFRICSHRAFLPGLLFYRGVSTYVAARKACVARAS